MQENYEMNKIYIIASPVANCQLMHVMIMFVNILNMICSRLFITQSICMKIPNLFLCIKMRLLILNSHIH